MDKHLVDLSEEEEKELIIKKSKSTVKSVGKSAISNLTGGVIDTFLCVFEAENELNEEIRKRKIENLISTYITKNNNHEKQLEKIKWCISLPYNYMLIQESIKIVDEKPYDELRTSNIAGDYR